jgi:hypothetical protein
MRCPGLTFTEGDAHELPFADGEFGARPYRARRGTVGVEQKSPMLTPAVAKRALSAATATTQVATRRQPAGQERASFDAVPDRSFVGRGSVPGADGYARIRGESGSGRWR